MDYVKNEQVFSWKIENNSQAIKKVDKSFYTYGETIIPIYGRKFFDIDKYSEGDRIEIEILFKDKSYTSFIRFENNFNRSKLILSKDLSKSVQYYINSACCKGDIYNNIINTSFVKENSYRYYMNLSIEI